MKKLAALLMFAFMAQTMPAYAQVGGAGGSDKPASSAPAPQAKKAAKSQPVPTRS